MGSFGIFKKLKDKLKQIKPWIRKALPVAREVIKQAAPVVQEITKDKPRFNKVNDLLSITDDGLEAADDIVNKNDSSSMIDWTKQNLVPRLKKLVSSFLYGNSFGVPFEEVF